MSCRRQYYDASTCQTLTSDRNGKWRTLAGGQHTFAHLDFVLAAVVALVLGLGVAEAEGHGGRKGRQRVAHGAVGPDQAQLKGTARVQGVGRARDVEALPFEHPPGRRLHGGVVRDLWTV